MKSKSRFNADTDMGNRFAISMVHVGAISASHSDVAYRDH